MQAEFEPIRIKRIMISIRPTGCTLLFVFFALSRVSSAELVYLAT